MKVLVRFADGHFSSIPCVKWHPEHGTATGQIDAGLWVGTKEIAAHLEKVNKFREEIGYELIPSVKDYISSIECAEAEFLIYHNESNDEPWKHYGLCAKRVAYEGDDEYWNNH